MTRHFIAIKGNYRLFTDVTPVIGSPTTQPKCKIIPKVTLSSNVHSS